MQNLTRSVIRSFSSKFKEVKVKQRMLTPKFYLHNYALLPMVILCVADMSWVAFCSFRTFIVADDVILSRRTLRYDERMDLLTDPVNKKFIKYQEYTPNPELAKAYKEMRDEELKRRQECNGK